MDWVSYACIFLALILVIISIVVVIRERVNTNKVLSRLQNMLDSAIDGRFDEQTYDETKLSAIESQMSRYLSSCVVSSKNLLKEKENINTLISDISHQTKTPIANILLYSQLLSEYPLNNDCNELVNNLVSQSEKLNFLIASLVKTSRLETGIISVIPKQNSVNNLINDAISQAKPKALNKGIKLFYNKCDFTADFDMKWTLEAIYNILDNAIKYSPLNSHIVVDVEMYEMFCRIDIEDSGIGIEEDEQSKIFSRFYRSVNVAEKEGVGIGLYLSREIISAQRGYIKVKSNIGKGSIFSVFLTVNYNDKL